MKSKAFLCLLATGLLLTMLGAEKSEKTSVIHLDHDTVAAAFAKGGLPPIRRQCQGPGRPPHRAG